MINEESQTEQPKEEIVEEPIDLNKLRPRELLILMATDVRQLKNDFSEMKKDQFKHALKLNTLETKSKVWAGVIGFASALVTLLFEKLLKL